MTDAARLRKILGSDVRRGWILDGAGPARYGWGKQTGQRVRFLGATAAEALARLDAADQTVIFDNARLWPQPPSMVVKRLGEWGKS
jgi:hypothetical protein